MKRTRALIEELMNPPPRLSIFQPEEGHVTFVDAEGHSRTFVTNGANERHQLQAGTVDTTTRWDGTTLVCESSIARGMKIVHTYQADDVRRLVVIVTLDDPRMGSAAANRRVYDAQGDR